MEKYTLGKIIQNNREMKGISKVKLCRGLCTVTALTRYEQGERMPDKFLADALLERLGLNPFRYEFIVSDQEFRYSIERLRLEKLLYQEKTEEAREALQKYELLIQERDILHWQYLMLQKAILFGKEENYYKAILVLKKALEYTKCSSINIKRPKDILLTNNETELFYLLAKFQDLVGEREEACFIYFMLKNYMEDKWDKEKWKGYYPHILYRLAQYELESHNLGKAYQFLSQAEAILTEYYQIDNLYEVLELKKTVCSALEIREEINEDFILALKLISMSHSGKLSKEGIDLWENTANRQL